MQIEFDSVALRHNGGRFGSFNGTAELEWDENFSEWIVWSIRVVNEDRHGSDLEFCHCAQDGSFHSTMFYGLSEGILEDCDTQITDATGEYFDGLKQEAAELAAAE